MPVAINGVIAVGYAGVAVEKKRLFVDFNYDVVLLDLAAAIEMKLGIRMPSSAC
jgi:hypothetical protein